VKGLRHTGARGIGPEGFATDSRQPKFSTLFWTTTAYVLIAIAAIELGIWAALQLSPHPTRSARSLVHMVNQMSGG
jgi:hypothetical protein